MTASCPFGFVCGAMKYGFEIGLDSFKELKKEVEEHSNKSKIK